MTASVKLVCVGLSGLALACLVLAPVLLALVGDEQVAARLGTGVFVLMVGATLGTTLAVGWSSRRDTALRRGATASAVCSALVVVSIGWLYLQSAPTAISVGPLLLLLVGLVAHVMVTALLPATGRR